MQDIHSIGGGGGGGGGGGRLFGGGGGGGGGDRRLRPHHHHQNHQPLKCPRCDSLNTKFCYYNNYNLSQPRHFCKSCRRYWTKGGVLRNVPVGGGCRKTKRSKPKQQQITPAPDTTTTTATTPPPQDQQDQPRQQRQREQLKSSNSHSSSESSSTLTATNTAATATTAVEAASGHSSSTKPPNTHNSSNCNTNNSDYITLSGINESKLFSNANNLDPNLEVGLQQQQQLEQGSSDCGIFSEIGSFSSLINTNNEQLQFGFGSLMMNQMGLGQGQDQSWQHQNHKMVHQQHQRIGGINGEEVKMQDDMGGGCVGGGDGGLIDDPTVQVEYGRFGALDWQGTTGDHHGLFDLHNTVDHAYWTSQSQWTDQDHPGLYLP